MLNNSAFTGLFSETTSNGFLVDISAPVIIQKPTLSQTLGSLVDNSVIIRSALRIEWNVEDKDSFIERQYISVATHSGGEFNSTSIKVALL